MRHAILINTLFLSAASIAAGCGGDDDESCNAVTEAGCASGLTCEVVSGTADTVCAAPVVVRGDVFDLATNDGIEGARIVALDANGTPVASVVTSDVDGNYELTVPTPRTVEGALVSLTLTLRADADSYQTFPAGLRTALPIDTSNPVDDGAGSLVVESSLTTIGLIELPSGVAYGSMSGSVELPAAGAGVLVVAELSGGLGGPIGTSGIADADGNYQIYNLAPGSYDVRAYALATQYTAATGEVVSNQDVDVDLSRAEGSGAVITGNVQIVNGGGGTATSVILVVASTFNDTLLRGESPPGIRAEGVTGEFSIAGVPDGQYVVLAGFENDLLVRDPDTSIGGTELVTIDVVDGADQTLAQSFKVTGALAFVAPLGEVTSVVTAAPVISWVDDSSEDAYIVTVYDAFGEVAWTTTTPGFSGDDPSVTYEGPLDPGMYYQVKIVSMKDGVPISTSEDLQGVFTAEAP